MDLFGSESLVIEEAQNVISNTNNLSKNELIIEYAKLFNAYNSLLNDTLKMTRISDSTQRKLKKVQNQLEEQNEKINEQNSQLIDLNATKDKFLSIISHDLRNPISAILLLTSVLSSNAGSLDDKEMQTVLQNIEKSTKNLYDLFENLLKWAKSQTGTFEFAPEEFLLSDVINRVFSLLEPSAKQKEIRLINNCAVNVSINADSNMIETIVRNLISNAIKFTNKDGEIVFSYELKDNNHYFSIKDNGVGMPEEIKNKLFKIGEHIKSMGTARETGSGLGLILCKEFVERHNGKIWVESEIGNGSVFYFTIPQ